MTKSRTKRFTLSIELYNRAKPITTAEAELQVFKSIVETGFDINLTNSGLEWNGNTVRKKRVVNKD